MSTMGATLMPSHRVFGPVVPALRPQRATGGHRRARGVAVRVTAMGANPVVVVNST